MNKKKIIQGAVYNGMLQSSTEISKFFDVVADLKPHHIMEIGSATGGTFFVWCKLSTGVKISLDLPGGNWGGVNGQRLSERNARMESWDPQVKVLLGDSHNPKSKEMISEILNGEKLDFLFIDGDHSAEGVEMDYEMYKDFVRTGGIIAFHDIKASSKHHSQGCFVDVFWNKLEAKKEEIIGPEDWGGIGYIIVEDE